MKTIRLDQLSVRFGHTQALDGVSVELRAGEVTMLVGPNGAGKSTLMAVLLGLVRPDRGNLLVDDIPTVAGPHFRSAVGYLPEAVAFSKNLSGRDVLRFFASARGVSRARVDATLARVSLDGAARRAVRGYSRGMLQRLGIAVAILSDPEVLVLDEPTGGLDQEGLTVLWSVLDEWRARGRFVLLASHELALLEPRVQHVVVLAGGRVIWAGRPPQLRAEASLPVRVTFEMDDDEAAASMRGRLALLGAAPLPAPVGQLLFEVGAGDLRAVLSAQADAAAVTRVRVEEPGFDVIYGHLLAQSQLSSARAAGEVTL